jgi:hypothetical protein
MSPDHRNPLRTRVARRFKSYYTFYDEQPGEESWLRIVTSTYGQAMTGQRISYTNSLFQIYDNASQITTPKFGTTSH